MIEFYIKLYRGKQTHEPKKGTFEECIDWMADNSKSNHWQEWATTSFSLISLAKEFILFSF